jgi:peptidyl-dipeptidase A
MLMRSVSLALLGLVLAGCHSQEKSEAPAETADQFVARVNREMLELSNEKSTAEWVQATYINDDTQKLTAKATERYLEYFSRAVEQSKRYAGEKLKPETARALQLLKLDVTAPAPNDAAKRAELTQIIARLEATYGEGKYCPSGPESCRNLDQLEEVLAKSRNYDELTDAWAGWHTISPPMRKDYERFVELANEGARELGYQDLGAMWRSNYDMPPDAFAQESERLWSQVKPLYDELHCYTRAQLAKKYGEERVPAGKPIPAQLLGNMWAQQWGKIYDLIEPYKGVANLNVDAALKRQGYDARRMTESAESFYKSLGFPALPQTFWERSMLTRPRDREVVCHASAWHMDFASDVRLKQCIRPAEEDLVTIYHELGHVYYFLSYRDQPFLFQDGANDGFHEAIGNTKPSQEALIDQQMKLALDRIAFLPFGELVDQWRWKVFSGEVTPANYNAAWWQLREQYQGVSPPVPRSEEDFDPGAKYHIPGNTPYARYFIAYVLQFQFHRALCEAAGFKGPLHECSVFGSEAAGQRFRDMLALGQSQPWQDTLEKLTGTREMDASAITDYFAPLTAWLRDRNQGLQCGW